MEDKYKSSYSEVAHCRIPNWWQCRPHLAASLFLGEMRKDNKQYATFKTLMGNIDGQYSRWPDRSCSDVLFLYVFFFLSLVLATLFFSFSLVLAFFHAYSFPFSSRYPFFLRLHSAISFSFLFPTWLLREEYITLA